ncbi:MAG TPA: hydrogenase nickel incorporation protein HypB [Capsulimonadaceae bacterium]|jgi:hydrogenase nickel incorporation protein HypB
MTTHASPRVIAIEEAVQGKNQERADRNRQMFHDAGVLTINMMSSPGSGKTALLETTLARFEGRKKAAVIVGDLATDNDAQRLSGHGAEVVQITTGGYCHLDADMIARALSGIGLQGLDILIIENVGNLVCPATFDLGEDLKIGLVSTTEGEDKPLKYPSLFARVDAAVINKIDIGEIVGWDRAAAHFALGKAAPQAKLFELSARTGQGVDEWCTWLEGQMH